MHFVNNEVLDHGERLEAEHDIGAQRNQCCSFNDASVLANEETGVGIVRDLLDALGENIDLRILDELAV